MAHERHVDDIFCEVPMLNYHVWLASIAITSAVIGLATSGLMFVLGTRFIKEFTRPGVTVSQDTPRWGGWKFPTGIPEPSHDLHRAVTFLSADGTTLRGEFWAQRHSAPTIIISHGFHLPCMHFRSVAALEYASGANILLFDYRGHGESSQIPTTCGNAEVEDLVAAVEVAVSQLETTPNKIYIHGFSMGAAVALLMPPSPAVAGIIADSAYARLDEMICLIIAQIFDQETSGLRGPARALRRLIPVFTFLTFTGGRLLFLAYFRRSLVARPELAIRLHAKEHHSPILLIHAESDPLISLRHAHRLVGAAHKVGISIQEYYTPCDIHCGSYGYDPQHYMTLLRGFINKARKAEIPMTLPHA